MTAAAEDRRVVGSVRLAADGPVVRALLDRPHVRNAIDPSLLDGLEAALALAGERDARVLVLRGAQGSFCAGADLAHVRALLDQPDELRAFMARIGAVLDGFERAPFAVVAVVEGHAVAGGLELLLACDVVLAASDARIGDHHVVYGLVPAAGSSVRLARALPRALASWLLLSGELLDGEQAARVGLVTRAVPAEALDAEAERVVARLAAGSADALRAGKAMLHGSRTLAYGEALARELDVFAAHADGSGDVTEGLEAFRAKRAPRF